MTADACNDTGFWKVFGAARSLPGQAQAATVSAFLSDAGGTATEGAEAEGTPDTSGGGEAPVGAGAADGGADQGASGGEQQPSLRKGSRS